MRIPWVIDDRSNRLADVLNELLSGHRGRSLDVATAYFTAGGFGFLQPGLEGLGNFRLLLGAEPQSGAELGLRPGSDAVRGLLPHPPTQHTGGFVHTHDGNGLGHEVAHRG